MKKKFELILTIVLAVSVFTAIISVNVSAAPKEVLVKHWGPDLIGDVRDNNPSAVGHNCGNPAKDGYGNVIGWEAVQDPENHDQMYDHMIFGCEEVLEEGDYVFEVRMKVSNMDSSYSSRFFNIDIYCANHAGYLGNLSVTRSLINSTETDENGYGIYRLEFSVDSKHSGELLEARIHFSNKCDAVVTDCSYIMLDSSVVMEDVEIPIEEYVTENAVIEDGTVITDPEKPGYIFENYINDKLPEGQLYMKMIFGLGGPINDMKNSNNIFKFEVLDVSGEEENTVASLIFTGKNFKFEDGEIWTPDQLYTLVMPFKVKEADVGKKLEFRVHGYGINNGRQEPFVFNIKKLIISDDSEIYDDPNKPVPVIYEFNEKTVTGDILENDMVYGVYKTEDTGFVKKLYDINTDASGNFTLATEAGTFWLVKDGESEPYIYFTVDDGETANFSIIGAELEDKNIFTAPENFDPREIKNIEPPKETVSESGTEYSSAEENNNGTSGEINTSKDINAEKKKSLEDTENTVKESGYEENHEENQFNALYVIIPFILVAGAALFAARKI